MSIDELLVDRLGIDINQGIWARSLQKFNVDTGEDRDELDCFDAYACKVSVKANQGDNIVKNISGCVVATTKGLAVLGAQEGRFPLTMFIKKQDMRVLQVSDRLLSTIGTITTNSMTVELTVPKKVSTKFEAMLNRTRNT